MILEEKEIFRIDKRKIICYNIKNFWKGKAVCQRVDDILYLLL